MAATVYQDTGYAGAYLRVRAGQFLGGRFLAGRASARTLYTDIPLDNEISSIRVEVGSLAVLYGGQSRSASGGARVIIGPRDVPDLGALGMGDRVSAVSVVGFDPYRTNLDGPPVVLHAGYARGGQFREIRGGDYDAARLAASEVAFPDNRLRSVQVPAGAVAVLYDGPAFDEDKDAIAIRGPAVVDDLDRHGIADRVSSIRVLRTRPASRAPNVRVPGDPFPGLPPGLSRAPPPPAGKKRRAPVGGRAAPPGTERAPPPKRGAPPVWAIILIVLLCLLLGMGVGAILHLKSRSRQYQPSARSPPPTQP